MSEERGLSALGPVMNNWGGQREDRGRGTNVKQMQLLTAAAIAFLCWSVLKKKQEVTFHSVSLDASVECTCVRRESLESPLTVLRVASQK